MAIISTIPLSNLVPGEGGLVRAVHDLDGFAYRLEALGFHVGRPVTVICRAPLGGPIQVRLGTTDVMLRRTDAARIEIIPN